MVSDQAKLVEALGRLEPPSHLCAIFESQEERFSVVVPFIRIGLERKEKCVYVAGGQNIVPVQEALRADGVDVEQAIRSGALTITTKEAVYFKGGYFDAERMFAFWKEASGQARADGFSALRATGEVDWLQEGAPGLERWMEYESRVTDTFSRNNCMALCQYDRRSCSPAEILDVIRTHPIVIYGSTVCRNFYHVPAEEFLEANPAGSQAARVLRDVQERERVEEALRRLNEAEGAVRAERQRFSDVLDQLPAYLVLLSRDYRVPFANRFFRERFGESRGRRCYEYLFNRTEPCEVCETYTVLKTNAPHRWEWTGPDGHNYDIYDFPFKDADGSALVMEVGLDITERKQTEAELEKYRQHLEELVQERTRQLEVANAQLRAEIAEHKQAEEEIRKQRQAILELSTPVLPLADRMLVVPLIGLLDAERATQLSNQLLAAVRQHRARVLVLDVTGVALIDSHGANGLIQAVECARLLGATTILTGISSGVARTLTDIGVELSKLRTMGDLQSGIEEANLILRADTEPALNPRAKHAAGRA
jgi:anti-anti-sigma factor